MHDSIWKTQLASPESPRSPDEEFQLVELLCLRDVLAPYIALSTGFNQIAMINQSFPEVHAAQLEKAFAGMTLRQALTQRDETELFAVTLNYYSPQGDLGPSAETLRDNAHQFLRRYLLEDESVSEEDVKTFNQYVTAESYINAQAVIKVEISRAPANANPRPQARTCFRTLKITDKHLTDYSTFKQNIEEAILYNGQELTRGD